MIDLKRLKQSFKDAAKGISYTIRHEQNFRIQLLATVFVVVFGIIFPLRKHEIIIITLLIVIVLILELLNTAVERILDVVKPRLSGKVEAVKDIMAAMVLIASVAAVCIGIAIFYPYFRDVF